MKIAGKILGPWKVAYLMNKYAYADIPFDRKSNDTPGVGVFLRQTGNFPKYSI